MKPETIKQLDIMSQVITHKGELVRINPKDGCIEISKDGGRVWRVRYRGTAHGKFIDLTDAVTEIIATTTMGVYASVDGGYTWRKRS